MALGTIEWKQLLSWNWYWYWYWLMVLDIGNQQISNLAYPGPVQYCNIGGIGTEVYIVLDTSK